MNNRRFLRVIAIIFGIILFLLLIGPFLVPIQPLDGLKQAEDLADPDSLFIEINELSVHYKISGEGSPVFILLHGFGASLYSWQTITEPLCEIGTVIAYDRPAFGLTERPLEWKGENPYSSQSQINILLGLMDKLGIENAILVGNSAGGTIAMQFYLQYPHRVEALILVDPAVYTFGGVRDDLGWLLRTPQMKRLGPLFARQIQERGPELLELAWYDPHNIPDGTVDLYKKPLQVENWDRSLWELTLATSDPHLVDNLDAFIGPILVIIGEADKIVPPEQTIRLADELPNATLVVIPRAGHVPHEEQPELFLEAITGFLAEIP